MTKIQWTAETRSIDELRAAYRAGLQIRKELGG